MQTIKKGIEFYAELINSGSTGATLHSFLGELTLSDPKNQIIKIKEKSPKIIEICDYYSGEKERLLDKGEKAGRLIRIINSIIEEKEKLVNMLSIENNENKAHDIYISFIHIVSILKSIDPEAEKELRIAKKKIEMCENIITSKEERHKKEIENHKKEIEKLKQIIKKNQDLTTEYQRI
jgi:hypothetical protein